MFEFHERGEEALKSIPFLVPLSKSLCLQIFTLGTAEPVFSVFCPTFQSASHLGRQNNARHLTIQSISNQLGSGLLRFQVHHKDLEAFCVD